MRLRRVGFIATGMIFVCFNVMADAVPMSDFIYLATGMSEAEVLYRIGPYDHETIAYDYYHNVLHKIWYYIPDQSEVGNRKWITEIRFNGHGHVTALNRYKPD